MYKESNRATDWLVKSSVSINGDLISYAKKLLANDMLVLLIKKKGCSELSKQDGARGVGECG